MVNSVGEEEYDRLMNLSMDDFDQSPDGFRKHSADYDLIKYLIPEYIEFNALSKGESRNLHWHLGQMYAINNNSDAAIEEMKQSYVDGSKTWECYVNGTIAFLQKDKAALMESLEALSQQENQMNIEFLEKFVTNFEASYKEAYKANY